MATLPRRPSGSAASRTETATGMKEDSPMSEQMLRDLMEHLTRLEEEVRQMKELVRRAQEEAARPWWQKIAGSHKDDAVFAEIAHLGAEIRRAERQKVAKEPGKK